MNRRDALQRVALVMGGTLSAPTLAAVLGGCNTASEKAAAIASFTPQTIQLLDEVTETIIPTTNTPGAKTAKVGEFIQLMIKDCYKQEDQQNFFSGLNDIEEKSKASYKKSFVELKQEERNEVFRKFEQEAFAQKNKDKADNKPVSQDKPEKKELPHPYFMLKDLTTLGYFTSEIGCTQTLEYVPIPGRYEGCIDLKPGQKAWAM